MKPVCIMILIPLLLAAAGGAPPARSGQVPDLSAWAVHDPARPLPPVVDAGPAGSPVPAPSDAVVLFDGSGLEAWAGAKDSPARWLVRDGYFEVAPKTGDIRTKVGFGDCQLHVEWMSPAPPEGTDQGRGNSGVFLMAVYEIQVLDNNGNRTYADGMASAVYGQYPPLANACRPPGEWQSYDIVFRRPRFAGGRLAEPARMTVLHNGVLVQDNVVLTGPTAHKARPAYAVHEDRLPIVLQDHGSRVRFRNIWLRELE